MDINQSRQLINVFNKGMNTDTSDAYLSSEQYRYAENLRFFTEGDSNSGELRLIEGWKNQDYDLRPYIIRMIAATQIRNYGIFVGLGYQCYLEDVDGELRERCNTNSYSIVRIDFDDPEKTPHRVLTTEMEIKSPLSLVTRYESENNIKLYVADGENLVWSVNIMEEDVLDPRQSQNNSFEFGGFDEPEIIEGQLKPAIVLYQYILYTKWSKSSPLSPLSKPIALFEKENDKPDKGSGPEDSSTRGVRITIKETKGEYTKIKVYRVTYDYVGLDPKIDLIADDELTSEYFVLNDKNSRSLGRYTPEELYSEEGFPIKAKHIESKNDYLFASGVLYVTDNSVMDAYNEWDASAQYEESEDYFNLSRKYTYREKIDGWQCKGNNISWRFTTRLVNIDDKHSGKDNQSRSLRRDEIYRYGIVLYDKYGYKMPVKWIADIRTPDNTQLPAIVENYENNRVVIRANILGIDFKVENLDHDLFPNYEIVRCNRTYEDRATVSLGILGRTLKPQYGDSNINGANYYAPLFITLGNMYTEHWWKYNSDGTPDTHDIGEDDSMATGAVSSYELLLFCSPEFSYIKNFEDNIRQGAYLSSCATYMPNINRESVRDWFDYDDADNYIHLKDNQTDPIQTISFDKYNDTSRLHFVLTELGMKISTANLFNATEEYSQDNNKLVEYIKFLDGDNSGLWARIGPNPDAKNNYYKLHVEKINNVDYAKPVFNFVLLNEKYTYPHENTITYHNSTKIDINKYKQFDFNNLLFSDSGNLTINNNSVFVDTNFTYVPWSTPTYQGNDTRMKNFFENGTNVALEDPYVVTSTDTGLGPNEFKKVKKVGGNTTDAGSVDVNRCICRFPVGSGGNGLLLTTNNPLYFSGWQPNDIDILVFNIRNQVTPYGGRSMYIRNTSTYGSHGLYFSNDSDLHSVFDGDCFILNFYYNALHTWNAELKFSMVPQIVTVYKIPLETDIDLDSDMGDSFKREPNKNIQDHAGSVKGYQQMRDAYLYNTAYNTDNFVIHTSGITEEYSSDNTYYDYRTVYSNQKENGESIDSWLKFKPANFIDVDTRYGQITGLKLFKDALIYWLETATGMFSVNERTMLLDVNETNIILGNGDVLQRYDYLSTVYGMRPGDDCSTASNTTLYWWDGFKRDIISYSGGQAVQPLRKEKLIANYINTHEDVRNPKMAYDVEYNEILMNIVDGGPIVYNESIQQFTSIYTAPFEHAVYSNDSLYLIKGGDIYKWNEYDEDAEGDGIFYPMIKYIINTNNTFVKVYDNVEFGGRFYGGDDGFINSNEDWRRFLEDDATQPLKFEFSTPLKQHSEIHPAITNREYDFRFAIPRNNNSDRGDRLRGKTMLCILTSNKDSKDRDDFSLQYIITKFRISWS